MVALLLRNCAINRWKNAAQRMICNRHGQKKPGTVEAPGEKWDRVGRRSIEYLDHNDDCEGIELKLLKPGFEKIEALKVVLRATISFVGRRDQFPQQPALGPE